MFEEKGAIRIEDVEEITNGLVLEKIVGLCTSEKDVCLF